MVQRGPGGDLPYRIRYMGIYLAVETRSGMVVSWDRKTSVHIQLHQRYKVGAGRRRDPLGPRLRAPRPGPAGPSGSWRTAEGWGRPCTMSHPRGGPRRPVGLPVLAGKRS